MEDVTEEIKHTREEEEEGGGRAVVVPLPRNPPLFLLSPLNLPSTQLPSASYHGNRQGAEYEGENGAD